MDPLLKAGTRIVILALISYTVFIVLEQKKHRATPKILFFLTLGLLLDITATMFMILGSPNSPFTLHGFIGYSALAAMLIDTILLWRFYLANDNEKQVSNIIHRYSLYAYLWWVIAFITGGVLVLMK